MPHATQLGEILDRLGIQLDLEDGDLIEGAIVIVKINTPQGATLAGASTGLNWFEYAGAADYAYTRGDIEQWRATDPDAYP